MFLKLWMAIELRDVHRNPLQEGFYVRTDKILGNNTIVQNIIYLSRRENILYQEGLKSVITPLQVSENTTFKPLSQGDLNWLRERLSRPEQTALNSHPQPI